MSPKQPETDERQASLDFGPPVPRVREALASEHRSLLEVLARAFFDDPVALHLFPEQAARRARYGSFAGLALEAFGEHARVHTDSSLRGAAIWQAPSPPPVGPLRQLRLLARLLALTRRRFPQALQLGERMSREHPEEPHWYLAVLGTDPVAQRLGVGSALLAPALSLCDEQRLPAYLESSKESNLPFYSRHGFEVLGEIRIPDGPTLWPMRRPPRR